MLEAKLDLRISTTSKATVHTCQDLVIARRLMVFPNLVVQRPVADAASGSCIRRNYDC